MGRKGEVFSTYSYRMLNKTNMNILNAMDYVKPLAVGHFFFFFCKGRGDLTTSFAFKKVIVIQLHTGGELNSRYYDRKSFWVKYSAGKREAAQSHTGWNGQKRLYRGDELRWDCHAYKEHSGLKKQIAYSHGGIIKHDLVHDFRGFHKTAEGERRKWTFQKKWTFLYVIKSL